MYFRALPSYTNTMPLTRAPLNELGTNSFQTVTANQADVFLHSQKTEPVTSTPSLKFSGWGSVLKLFNAINTGVTTGKNCREFLDRHAPKPEKHHRSKRHKPRYETYEVDVYRHGRYHHTEVRRRRI